MPSLMSLIYSFMAIIIPLLFVRNSVSETFNCSSTRASYIYCLDSNLPSTWYNNNSVVINGWQMRVFLPYKIDHDPTFYCGFYCSGSCNSYTFSIVSVGENNHSGVWSANQKSPVKGNATVQLTKEALVLRNSDGKQIWSSAMSSGSILGMKLNETGSLNLFNNQSGTVWQSPENKPAIIVPSPHSVPAAQGPNLDISPSLHPPRSPPPPLAGGGMSGGLIAIIAGSRAAGLISIVIVLLLLIYRRFYL